MSILSYIWFILSYIWPLYNPYNMQFCRAVAQGNIKRVRQLLKMGVNPRMYDNLPIRMAVEHGHVGIFLLLIAHGANYEFLGESLTILALLNGHPLIANIIELMEGRAPLFSK